MSVIEPQLFLAAKPGERARTCQDVGWFHPNVGPGGVAGFAVADGATGGWDGQRWAELSVTAAADAIVAADGRLDGRWVRSTFADELDGARARWRSENASAPQDDDPIRALARTKFLITGGHCTLAMGSIVDAGNGERSLRAFAVGDTPVLHLRPGPDGYRLLASAPLDRSEQFDRTPHLLSSRSPEPGAVVAGMVAIDIDGVLPGDCLLVMTDALAQWALLRHEHNAAAWDVLARLDHAGFLSLIDRIRTAGELVSDDVLLLRMVVADQPFRALPAVAPIEGGQ